MREKQTKELREFSRKNDKKIKCLKEEEKIKNIHRADKIRNEEKEKK